MFLLCRCGGLQGLGLFWTCSPSPLIPLPSRERGILSVVLDLLLPHPVDSRLRGNDGLKDYDDLQDWDVTHMDGYGLGDLTWMTGMCCLSGGFQNQDSQD